MKPVKIKLKVLSPLHIGSGDSLSSFDYIVRGNFLCVVDFDALTEKLVQRSPQLIPRVFGPDLSREGLARQLQKFAPALLNDDEIVLRKIRFAEGTSPSALRGFKPFIATGGRPFLPGSSIKGAIRTALAFKALSEDSDKLSQLAGRFHQIFKELEEQERAKKEWGKARGRKPRRDECGKFVESIVFRGGMGSIDKDAMALLGVSDSRPFSRDITQVTRIGRYSSTRGNEWHGKDRNLAFYAEVVSPGAETEFEIAFPTEKQRQMMRRRTESVIPKDPRELFRALNGFSEAVIDFELEHFFNEYYRQPGHEKATLVVQFLREVKEKARRGDTAVLPLGFGTGWASKTVGLLFAKDRESKLWREIWRACIRNKRSNELAFPKTKALAGVPPYVLGWVELSLA